MEEVENLCDRVTIIHRGKIVVTGTPSNLKSSLHSKNLDEVFEHYADHSEKGGGYRETARARRTAQRLG